MEVSAMVFTENEKKCFKRFLFTEFQTIELLSLVETITNRMITVQNKKEAIKAIISYSGNALELLRRKKVKREHIFRFLASENVTVSPTSDTATLIRQFLRHCGTKAPAFEEAEEVAVERNQKIHVTASSVSYTYVQHVQQHVEQHIHVSGNSSTQALSSTQELAKQFTSWFYGQLNSSAQGSTTTPSEWGPQHFWEDSRLRLVIITSERQNQVFEGAELVAKRLLSFVSDEGLTFNPNTGPRGTSGSDDPHGLVIVRACGTVHQHNVCLGLFEQQFGLIRDPMKQNTWKIKFTDMNLRQCAVDRMPTLEGPPERLLAIT